MPWYKIPRAGGATMWFDRERPDLEPADVPSAEPVASEGPEKSTARKPRTGDRSPESEAKADR